MAIANWPATLPQSFHLNGFSREYPENRLRTRVDVGPAKVRRRQTLAAAKMTGNMYLDTTQKTELDTFIETTTISGSLCFNFPVPEGGTVVCRFGEALPLISMVSPDTYMVTIELEILP